MMHSCHHQFSTHCRWCISERRARYGRAVDLRNRLRYRNHGNSLVQHELNSHQIHVTNDSDSDSDSEGLTSREFSAIAKRYIYIYREHPTEWACPICLSPDTEDIDETCCSHMFHHQCLTVWLSSRHTCPLCRFSFLQ